MKLMEPFKTKLNMQTGILQPVGQVIQRHLSDMQGMFADDDATQQILEREGDRLIYVVYVVELPEEAGQVLHCTTVIHPGRVGNEYHMTKGHFHAKRECAELYLGLTGQGYLVMQTEDGTVKRMPMQPGTVAYIPPYWAHRTVNTGNEPFTFFSAWPGDAGHNYGTIEQQGFAQILVERNGQPSLVDNPRYRGT